MKAQFFKPTSAMRLYAVSLSKQGDEVPQKKLADQVGVSPETVSRWKAVPGFDEWLSSEVLTLRKPILETLESIALSRTDDFRYFDALAKRFGFYAQASPKLEENYSPPTDID